MKQLIGHACRLTIFLNNNNLTYTVKEILDVTDTHITIKDKYDEIYVFQIINVVQIQDLKKTKNGGLKKYE